MKRPGLWFDQKGKCAYCGVRMTLVRRNWRQPNFATLDHVVPKAWGGPDSQDNLVYACRSCNHKKADQLPEGAEEGRIRVGNWIITNRGIVWAGGPGTLEGVMEEVHV